MGKGAAIVGGAFAVLVAAACDDARTGAQLEQDTSASGEQGDVGASDGSGPASGAGAGPDGGSAGGGPAGGGPAGGGGDGCSRSAVVAGNGTRTVGIRYAPRDEGADGGRVVVRTDVPGNEEIEVNLFGRGTNMSLPNCLAEARVAGRGEWGIYPNEDELLETIPLRTVELRGVNSRNPAGIVAGYEWTVLERPEDSTARLLPHAGAPEVSFFVDLAGLYVFELEVTNRWGWAGNPNCHVVVEACCGQNIHVQLVWDTPGDPDQTDVGFRAGADVDLHFLRRPGDWFCSPEDTFHGNMNPDWGLVGDASDDPSLDIDDADGAGPENANLDDPSDGQDYRIGVHYSADNGFGPSWATVRVFVSGTLRFEESRELTVAGQFWEVADIAWPSGELSAVDNVFDTPEDPRCPVR